MPAEPMPCKYDPTHGSFVTPVKLSQHYAAEHADVWVPKKRVMRRYRCALCGQVFRNPSAHMQQRHPEQPRPYVGRVMLRIEDGDEGISFGRRRGASNGVDVLDTLHDLEDQRRAATQATPRHVGPWEVDDIVLPVVEQLASPKGLIPVAHLAAILAWRDATAVMLNAVTT